MRRRTHNLISLLLALLVAMSAGLPLPGRAEAQMRCAGASPYAAPCARATFAGEGVTNQQARAVLMPCCRTMARGCSMRQPSTRHGGFLNSPRMGRVSRRAALSACRCRVFVRVSAAPGVAAMRRDRWLLAAAPALTPSPIALAALPPAASGLPLFWASAPALSPPAAPHGNGLRAPPSA